MIQKLRPFGVYGMGSLKGTDLISAMATFIAQHEGNNPNFAGNNNPGNLIYVQGGWNYPGAQPGAGGFAKYPDATTGQAALAHQIQVQVNNGQTLTQFFNQYAPGNTTNAAGGVQTPAATQAYIDQASAALGIPTNIPLNQVQAGTYDPTATEVASSSTDGTTNTTYSGVDAFGNPIDATSIDTSGTTLADMFSNTDPTLLIVGGIVAAGVLYVMFGR